MFNTMNDPLGWGGKVFYRSPAPSSAQWCVTSILTLGTSEYDMPCVGMAMYLLSEL